MKAQINALFISIIASFAISTTAATAPSDSASVLKDSLSAQNVSWDIALVALVVAE